MSAAEAIRTTRIVPVVEIEDVERAAPLARALVDGGIPVIEVTMRTPAALAAIREIAREVPEMTVGAGTVLDAEQAREAAAAGAAFLVSPGFAPGISEAAAGLGLPLYPGAVTASEVLQAMAAGHRVLKFFPAEASGGLPVLRALSAPLAHAGVAFMPTGGVTLANLADYLAAPGVVAVGGTWIARRADIARGDFAGITAAARDAARVAASV